jgi:hypothetical protein
MANKERSGNDIPRTPTPQVPRDIPPQRSPAYDGGFTRGGVVNQPTVQDILPPPTKPGKR